MGDNVLPSPSRENFCKASSISPLTERLVSDGFFYWGVAPGMSDCHSQGHVHNKGKPCIFFFLLNGWLNAIQSFAKEHILTKKPNTSLLEVEILLFGGGMSATVPLPKLCILPTPNTCISAKHSFETI